MLLSEAAAEFTKYLRSKGRSPHTVRSYGIDLRRFGRYLRQELGREPEVGEITFRELDGFLYHLLELGLAASSRRYAGYVLRSFFKFCRHIRVISDDPAADLTPVSIPKRLPVYLDSSEVQLFLDRCHDPLVKAVAGTLYHTGLRISELCGLKLSDADLRRGTLRVMGKGSKERMVPLNQRCRDILLRYLVNVRPDSRFEPFFLTKRGRPLDRSYAAGLLRREVKRQKWDSPITPHTFRHSCATALCQRGVGVPVVAQLLGHANIQTTMIYTHLNPENLREAVERLD